MSTKYKVWIEIERLENYGTDDETSSDEECPISVDIRDTLEEAIALQEKLWNNHFKT